jgi:hypothetical protein
MFWIFYAATFVLALAVAIAMMAIRLALATAGRALGVVRLLLSATFLYL